MCPRRTAYCLFDLSSHRGNRGEVFRCGFGKSTLGVYFDVADQRSLLTFQAI